MVLDALAEHEDDILGLLIDDGWKKVFLALFQEGQESAMKNV